MDTPHTPQPPNNRSGALLPVQPTFDIWSISADVGQVILRLLRACAEDDVQGLVLHPLRTFGSLLSVDGRRISEGQDLLKKKPHRIITLLKIAIGLNGRGLATIVAHDHCLTGAFQFAIGCSPILTVEETGRLMHEIMMLDKGTSDDLYGYGAVEPFVRSLIAYGGLMQENPHQLFTTIEMAVLGVISRKEAFPRLWESSSVPRLARLLHKIFESMQDMENKYISLHGSDSGLLIATLLHWLLPNDTSISVGVNRILPLNRDVSVRLHISFVQPQGNQFSLEDTKWKLKKWRSGHDFKSMLPKSEDEETLDNYLREYRFPTYYPIRSARNQMEGTGASEEVVEAAGHLAGALVDTIFEHGYICSSVDSSALPLGDVCSEYFLNCHHNIMEQFGWNNLDLHRQNRIAEVLKTRFKDISDQPKKDDLQFLGEALHDGAKGYFDKYGHHMLVSSSGHLNDAVERGIHLATEATFFSLCSKPPVMAKYRPLTTDRLRRNAKILRGLISTPNNSEGSQRRKGTLKRGLSFLDFRALVIQAMLHCVTEVRPTDLVVSSNGYVAYSPFLETLESSATEKRRVSSLLIIPGRLRQQDGGPCFERLIWQHESDILSCRLLGGPVKVISLFSREKDFLGLNEDEAVGNTKRNVEHLVSTYQDQTLGNLLYLTTFINMVSDTGGLHDLRERNPGTERIPTNWPRSIEAILFANHVTEYTLAPAQEKALAQRWNEKGHLRDLVWNNPGQAALSNRRLVTRTSSDEQLRFFEAGNLSYGRKVFIRQGPVPLMQCLKVAFECCEENPDWVIVS